MTATDLAWLGNDPQARVVLVRPTRETEAVYANAAPGRIVSVLGPLQRVLRGPDRVASARGGIRRLLLGPGDDGFAAYEKLIA